MNDSEIDHSKIVLPSAEVTDWESESGPPITINGPDGEGLCRRAANDPAVWAALRHPGCSIEGPNYELANVMEALPDYLDFDFELNVGGGWFVAKARGTQPCG